jgi:hypothetical protein
MIHCVIKEERRKAPRQLAIEINNDLRTQTGTDAKGMPVYQITPRPAQLHSMGTRIDDEANILYCAEWDQKAPYVTVIKGDMADLRMGFLGWPTVTKEQWEAEQPETPV